MNLETWLPSEFSRDIWHRKYQNNNETFEQWLDRVSDGDITVKQLILDKKFIFAGRILANRGLQKLGKKITYSNCYDIPTPEDNLESIFDAGKYMARTYSYGGGCGTGLYKLRPIDDPVNNAAEKSSGSVSFSELYNVITKIISQKGRRGALMLFQMVNHPDIETFIKLKSDLKSLDKTNISVGVLNNFLDAVRNDITYNLEFNGKVYRTIKAKDLLLQIAFEAWDTGDPGILYWDNITNWNIVSEDEEYVVDAPNPCGEKPMMKWEACNLAPINLSNFVINPFTSDASFATMDFKSVIYLSVNEMNKLIDEGADLHPLPEQRQAVKDWRNIGIEIMGMADMLVKMGITYGSEEHINLIHKVGSTMIDSALKQSAYLAKVHGPYPKYKAEKVLNSPFILANASTETYNLIKKYGLRNCSLLTIGPTGTISNLWELSGGIEPFYDISYQRKTESLFGKDKYYTVYTKTIEDYAEINGLKKDENGEYINLPDFITMSTAKKIPWHDRLEVQAAWQRYIDSAISSTVNLPKEATVEDVFNIYLKAGELGIKGITIFRDGCRKMGILTSEKRDELEDNEVDYKFDYIEPISTRKLGETHGDTSGKRTACGKMYITINHDDKGNLVQSFINTDKSGQCPANINGINRLISLCLRSGVKVEEIVDQLKGIRCDSCRTLISKGTKLDGISCPDCIARVLDEKYKAIKKIEVSPAKVAVKKKEVIKEESEEFQSETFNCPECGAVLKPQGGCPICLNCGWSNCG